MDTFTYDINELEGLMDQVKALTLRDLILKGLLEYDAAEDYAINHTILLRKPGIFRTISDKWLKAQNTIGKGYRIIIVSTNSTLSKTDAVEMGKNAEAAIEEKNVTTEDE